MPPFSHPPHATGTPHGTETPHTIGTEPRAPFPVGISACALPTPDPTPPTPQLLSRHLLLLTIAGRRTVDVDFVEQRCQPGVLLLARPGQALCVDGRTTDDPRPGLESVVIAWEPAAHPLVDGLDPDEYPLPVRHQLVGPDGDALRDGVIQLAADCHRLAPEALATNALAGALLRHQLAALLLRVTLLSGTAPVAADHSMTRFRRLLEQRYADTRRVEDYAAQLGCSVRTLTRASLAATGRTAKQVVDDRVALEAKRLLAATSLPVADVGRRLGFPEPTNFGRFFHREVGHSPGAFRAGACHFPGNSTPVGPPSNDSL